MHVVNTKNALSRCLMCNYEMKAPTSSIQNYFTELHSQMHKIKSAQWWSLPIRLPYLSAKLLNITPLISRMNCTVNLYSNFFKFLCGWICNISHLSLSLAFLLMLIIMPSILLRPGMRMLVVLESLRQPSAYENNAFFDDFKAIKIIVPLELLSVIQTLNRHWICFCTVHKMLKSLQISCDRYDSYCCRHS